MQIRNSDASQRGRTMASVRPGRERQGATEERDGEPSFGRGQVDAVIVGTAQARSPRGMGEADGVGMKPRCVVRINPWLRYCSIEDWNLMTGQGGSQTITQQ